MCVVAGCRDGDNLAKPSISGQPTSTQPTTAPATYASATDLDALIAKQGSVTFRSFDGKWIGRDGDTDLTFLPKAAVHMFEYGVGVSGYHGTYAIDPRGNITLQLPTFGHAWPVMLLQRDATSLLLVPAQNGNGLVMGNRGGATFAPGQRTYWPFRPLDAAEEVQVRQRIKK
jgi:hypothetical protein